MGVLRVCSHLQQLVWNFLGQITTGFDMQSGGQQSRIQVLDLLLLIIFRTDPPNPHKEPSYPCTPEGIFREGDSVSKEVSRERKL